MISIDGDVAAVGIPGFVGTSGITTDSVSVEGTACESVDGAVAGSMTDTPRAVVGTPIFASVAASWGSNNSDVTGKFPTTGPYGIGSVPYWGGENGSADRVL